MSEFLRHEPCPQCKSADNLARYADGSAYCHSPTCNYKERGGKNDVQDTFNFEAEPTFIPVKYANITKRGLKKSVCEKMGYGVSIHNPDTGTGGYFNHKTGKRESCHVANHYNDSGELVMQQIRLGSGKDKHFATIGKPTALFGMHRNTKAKRVIITEGQIDAVSIAQLHNARWPVVSVPNGAAGASKAILRNLKWLSKFEQIVICFDNDDAGQEAALQVAEILPPGTAYIAKLPMKDANEMVLAGRAGEIEDALWNAPLWRPDSIKGMNEVDMEALKDFNIEGLEIPFPKLNECAQGFKKGKLWFWIARPGTGKTTIVKYLSNHFMDQGMRVGALCLEEQGIATQLSMLAMRKQVPWSLVEQNRGVLGTDEEIKQQLEELNDRFYFYDHKGCASTSDILTEMRYMFVALKCDIVLLDGIRAAMPYVGKTLGGSSYERHEKFASELQRMVIETGGTVFSIMHTVKNMVDKDGNEKHTVDRSDALFGGAYETVADFYMGIERQRGKDKAYLRCFKSRGAATEEDYLDCVRYDREKGVIYVDNEEKEII
jgi:twinkle protein